MSDIPHILAHDHDDNVAVVVVEGLKAGTKMRGVVTSDNSLLKAPRNLKEPVCCRFSSFR